MTSLPIPKDWSGATNPAQSGPVPLESDNAGIGNSGPEREQYLLLAFQTFSEAASSLECSYNKLKKEVERLRRELEESNAGLARSLEENRQMRCHLDRILEALPCGVLVTSVDGRITRTNPEAVRLLGMDGEDSLNSLENIRSLPAPILELLDCAHSSEAEAEISIPGEENSKRWLSARHALVSENVGSSSVFILQNATERKHLEQAQQKLRREQALAEMSAVLAHEIRNPLGSLELFAGLLAESDLDSDSRKWVEHVQAGLRSLSATVNNVLHFHSLPEPECTPVHLGRLLEWAQMFLAPLAHQAGIELKLENALASRTLSADGHRLEQVLLNLVLNAIRALPGGGWVKLSGREIQHGRAVSISVSDSGPGIPVAHLPRIFEPGFSTRPSSPGLGLAICRKIVEQHHGAIRATSEPGCGATFTVIFPLTATPVTGATE